METRDSISDIWGPRQPYQGEGGWPERVDQFLSEAAPPDRWVKTACVLCSNGCACDLAVKDGRLVGVRGRSADHVNRGRLGPKGLHGFLANNSPDRIETPLIRGRDGRLVKASWDEAFAMIVAEVRRILKRLGPRGLGFYTSGQLFLEDYYTLALVAHGGLRTSNVDGNTRLCTATAAAALGETFGSDGQPSSYADIDTTACLLVVGHNIAHTQTVLWSRILDRRRGPSPPALVVIDPRETPTAGEADIHLAPRAGTNVALLNGLMYLLIERGLISVPFIEEHTVGFSELKAVVAAYPPQRVEAITGVATAQLHRAADVLGNAPTLLATVLQGVYQANQATAAAVQVNNLLLVRGMIGRPGAGVLQMNGQPTAQNTRETGCNGEFPVFFNPKNLTHMRRLAEHWNLPLDTFVNSGGPTDILRMLSMIESGSLRLFWVAGTNPAVSLPDSSRVRRLLSKAGLFLIVQDAFLTETAQLASVVLPTALWAEKDGVFTNAERTVHFSAKAIEPPGQALSDFEIFRQLAQRLDLRSQDGAPLVPWTTTAEAFAHFAALTSGRLCDYSHLSHQILAESDSGIRWPCNAATPQGATRLYEDLRFPTAADVCQTFGHDLETGRPLTGADYRRVDALGKARLKAAHYRASADAPTTEFPFVLLSGRNPYHFHTRSKTGRVAKLDNAAPEAYVEISRDDAMRLGFSEGQTIRIISRQGEITAPIRMSSMLAGHVFVPFHYGAWQPKPACLQAANELTHTAWDPISKQPLLKNQLVRLEPGIDT